MSIQATELANLGDRLKYRNHESKDHVTVVEHIYHGGAETQPFSISPGYSRFLRTKEQVYQRRTKAVPEWTQISTGWLEKYSLILIVNLEGKAQQTIPTKEETDALNQLVLEVSTGGDSWLIYPGESMRGCPASPENLKIRCLSGEARYLIVVVPE